MSSKIILRRLKEAFCRLQPSNLFANTLPQALPTRLNPQQNKDLAEVQRVHQDTLDAIGHALGVRRWRLLGFEFGPRNKITDVALYVSTTGKFAGMELGAFAKVNGKLNKIEGDLFDRIAIDHVNLLEAQQDARKTPTKPIPATSVEMTAESRRPSVNSDSSETPTLVGRASPSLMQSNSESTLVDNAPAPMSEDEIWNRYCDAAENRTRFASRILVQALSAAIDKKLRIVTFDTSGGNHYDVQYVSPKNSGEAFADDAEGVLNLYLDASAIHYRPLDPSFISSESCGLKKLTEGKGQNFDEVKKDLERFSQESATDGSCFFDSVGKLIGEDSQKLREKTLVKMREYKNIEQFSKDFGFAAYETNEAEYRAIAGQQ